MNQTEAALISPESAAFARTLQIAGAKHWEDASFPYRLAGAGAVLRIEGPAGAGVIGLTLRPGYVRGEPVPLAILRDLAVEPAARGKGMGRLLVRAAISEARSQGAVVAVFGAGGPGLPISGLDRASDDIPAFRRSALLSTTRLVPALGRWEEPEYKIFRTANADVPALAYMLDLYRRGLAFAPPTDETGFRAGAAVCPGLAVTDFRIARYKNEMVAMAGIWEPHLALPIAALRPTLIERMVGAGAWALGPLTSIPRLPRPGEPLRVRFVRAYAIKRDHHAAFRCLLDRIANEARKAGVHVLEFTLPHGDPMGDGVKGRVRRRRTQSIWAASLADVSLDDLGPVDAGILDPGA